tara:strand:- start:3033 stop:3239 length:207 start_codon:yes stop_codon:yes gene_type:complete
MKYIKIKFTFGLDCEAYQVLNNMLVVGYVDLDGNPLELPEITESMVIDPEIQEDLFPQPEENTDVTNP